MKRRIIEIDEALCTGCGACIPDCPEGALQLIDGKARLVSDLFCDGLGACIRECPTGAMKIVERETEPYDERKTMDNIVKHGPKTIKAHLKHLKEHGEIRLLETAINALKDYGMPIPEFEELSVLPCSCPATWAKRLDKLPDHPLSTSAPSNLRQWPVQLKLLNVEAEYFDNADLLISADCVAHAHGGFHQELLRGKILIILCPKLDGEIDKYIEKLSEILRLHNIKSITVARMEVPCCGGINLITQKAMELAGKTDIPLKLITVTINGETQN